MWLSLHKRINIYLTPVSLSKLAKQSGLSATALANPGVNTHNLDGDIIFADLSVLFL